MKEKQDTIQMDKRDTETKWNRTTRLQDTEHNQLERKTEKYDINSG